MKLVSLKRTKDDKAAEGRGGAMPSTIDDSPDGADLHLEGDHLKKMGVDSTLPHGHKIRIEGEGTVHRSSDGPEGGRMQIKLHRAGAEYDEPKERAEKSLRDDLEKNTKGSEDKREAGEKARAEKRKPAQAEAEAE